MPIETSCPGCGRLLRVADEHYGKQARCPICNTVYTVPDSRTGELQPAEGLAGHAGAERARQDSPVWSMKTPEGQIYGPVRKAELDQWVADGRVAADCQLSCGDGHWEPADRLYPVLTPQPAQPARPAVGAAANPFRTGEYPTTTAAASAAASRHQYVQPHRGPLILILAIVSWVMGCPIFGIVAWVMGSTDLREMRAGRMDQSGMGLTQAGYILGMIHALIFIVICVFVLFFFIIAAAGAAF